MIAVGFRCFPEGFSYVVLEGSQASPRRLCHKALKLPKNQPRGQALAWTRKQVLEILNEWDPDRAAIKRAETAARSKSLTRSEVEGVVKEVVWSRVGFDCTPRLKSQIKRDIRGFSGPAKYLETVLSSGDLRALNKPAFLDAALVAIAELPPK